MNADRVFRVFLIGQFALWAIFPALLFNNLPMDVVEGLTWGHGWPLGTYKHPPLQAWLLESAAILGGRSDLAIYALSAAGLAVTYAALWKLGRMLLPERQALTGVMAMAACFYFGTTIPEFNPNVVQIPLYALCGLFFWRGYKGDHILDWLALGFIAGLGLWGKYSFALLFSGFGLFAILEPAARILWRRPGPYLAALTAALVFLPHALWLIETAGLPFAYAASRTQEAADWAQRLGWPLKFLLTQMLAIAPVLVILWLSRARSAAQTMPRDTQNYLALLAFAPMAATLVLILLTGHKPRDMWGMPFWPFLGLFAAGIWRSDVGRSQLARLALLLAMAIMPTALWIGDRMSHELGYPAWRTQFPGKMLAHEADLFWQEHNGTRALPFVLGNSWYGGNIAWYGQNRAQVMLDGSTTQSPWVAPEFVARDGAIAVWDPDGGSPDVPGWASALGPVHATKIVALPYGNRAIRAKFALIGGP